MSVGMWSANHSNFQKAQTGSLEQISWLDYGACILATGSVRDPASMTKVKSNQGRLLTSILDLHTHVDMRTHANVYTYTHAHASIHACMHNIPNFKSVITPNLWTYQLPCIDQDPTMTWFIVSDYCISMCGHREYKFDKFVSLVNEERVSVLSSNYKVFCGGNRSFLLGDKCIFLADRASEQA